MLCTKRLFGSSAVVVSSQNANREWIYHQEQTMIGELLVECSHHLFEGAFIIGDLASVGEGKADTQCV